MITKVWVIVHAYMRCDASRVLETSHFYLSPLAAELAIIDKEMQLDWEVKELTLGERS